VNENLDVIEVLLVEDDPGDVVLIRDVVRQIDDFFVSVVKLANRP
jgi:hypothetical protein